MSRPSALRIVSASFLVTGNMVGAGILGLPIRTGLAGFWISVAALGGVWVLMLLSAMFLADRVLALGDPEADIPTLLAHALGPAGRWVILALSLFLYWTIMVAYLCGGTAILADLLGLTGSAWWVMLLFFLVLTLPVFFGLGLVQRCNAGLMAAMWLSFGALLALGAPQIRAARLEWAVWGLLPAAVPVMVGACVFHFVVPAVCRSLDFHRASVRRALVLGGAVGLGMNLVWMLVVCGTLPVSNAGPDNILFAHQAALPATIPLSGVLHSAWITAFGAIFSLVAIGTSYLTVGVAMRGFARDLVRVVLGVDRPVLAVVVGFVPSLAVAMVWPGLFLAALDLLAGVGLTVLYGVLPGVLALQAGLGRRWRAGAVVLVGFCSAVAVMELGQTVGLVHFDVVALVGAGGFHHL